MDMQAAIKNRLRYYKRVQNDIDAHKTKASLVSLRKHWLERQKVHNYQNEYDRIRGILDQSVTGALTNDLLNKRKTELERFGAKIVDRIV
jgi:hypothetical protein